MPDANVKSRNSVSRPAGTAAAQPRGCTNLKLRQLSRAVTRHYDALVSAFGEDAEALEIGDGALWFENNDRGYFLKGPVMIRLQVTHVTEGDLDSFRDPTIALGEAALAKI